MSRDGLLSPPVQLGRVLVRVLLIVAALTLGLLHTSNRAHALTLGFVRVNQIGYTTGTPMRAYLMTSGALSGATFSVETSTGKVVYTAPVGAELGAWSARFPDVYALDFGSDLAAGMYDIAVDGPITVSFPNFAIDTGQNLYSQALTNAASFYSNEGDGPNYIPSPLRTAPAHLNDRHAMTYLTPKVNGNGQFRGDLTPLGVRIDASGGWWDAGDYLKFVETTSYVSDLQLLGVRDFPHLIGAGSNFGNEARFGMDWLQKMWDDRTKTLYYQVGIGAGNAKTMSDHDIWRLPQRDDSYGGSDALYRYIRNRPVFRAAPPGSLISPNLAGRDAAAMALCFQVYRERDPTYADTCLLAAEHIFDLANTSPSGDLLTAIPFGFYPETSWRDDLELGATELYLAVASGDLPPGLPYTDPHFYLTRAAHWAHAYIAAPHAPDTLNLYDVSGVAHYELYNALKRARKPAGLEVTPQALLADLKKQLDGAVAQSSLDPFGFGFPWDTYDTTTHGFGLVVMASEYDQLTHTDTYARYGRRWLANVLGANAWGSSLVVGDGHVFPHCLQHQVANLVGSLNGSPPILAGAVVEGSNSMATTGSLPGMRTCPADRTDKFAPFNSAAVFRDNVQSYSTVEPAIDLSVSSSLAFARYVEGLQ